jgi:hypothetical protein
MSIGFTYYNIYVDFQSVVRSFALHRNIATEMDTATAVRTVFVTLRNAQTIRYIRAIITM